MVVEEKVETPDGTEISIHLRRPNVPVTEELTKSISEAHNHVAAGLIQRLELDFR